MRNRLRLVVPIIFISLGVGPLLASDLVLIHARVYPSPEIPAVENATIVVHNDRIDSLSSGNGSVPHIPSGAVVLDCTGMTVTAGLWNSHVHILPAKLLHADQKTGAELTAALQEMLTSHGFTTVFDVASIFSNTNDIRRRIASGEVLGPRILTTGEPFFPPHGVPVYVQAYLEQNHIVLPDDATTAAAVTRVSRQIHEGADGIKIFAGSIEENGVLPMPLERAKAIVAEAHRLNRPVFAHPSNLAGVEIALDSGVDVLAHVTSEDGQGWSLQLVQRMRAAHTALIPTLTLFDYEAKKGGVPPEKRKAFIDQAVTRLRAYNAAGGEVLFGTDVGYIYQFDTAEEYELMQQAGMSFAQILASVTINPASRFGLSDHSGRVESNMDADLTVFTDDPNVDITAFSRVRYAIRGGGIIFESPKPNPIAR